MKRIVCLFVVLATVMLMAMGQENDIASTSAPHRKKVALVLSGGGAKGSAHIGVLKVLERAGIPIDIITGTSMGSIVGGLYACGHSAQELDSVMRGADWSFVLSDREDLSHQSLREREKQNTYVIKKEISFGKSANADGGGFILGKNIVALFDALTMPYNDSIDFNTLPIPFACVATDIVDNTEVVFHSGVLSQAMRASMSIPGAFSPVRSGDKVLVDGGLRNNYPTDIARAMGADYIIGVNVQSDLRTASGLNSTSSILLQIVDHNCKNKFDENLKLTDIPIRVNTNGYSAASFNKAAIDTLIRRGEEAAMAHWNELIALRDRLALSGTEALPRMATAHIPLPVRTRFKVKEIAFHNMTKNDQRYILDRYHLRVGDSIDMDRADIITTTIRQDLYYKSAKFRFINTPGEGAKLVFTAGPKRNTQVNVGLRFDTEEMVALQANAEFPFRTKVPMDMELTLRLGKRIMARADWSLHPKSFIRPTLSYVFRRNDVDFYEYGDKAYSLTYNQHTVKLSLINFNVKNFNVNISASWDYYNYQNLLVDRKPVHVKEANLEDKGYITYEGTVSYNSENDYYFPTRGAKFHAKYAYFTDNFIRLNGQVGMEEYCAMWRMNFPLSRRFSIQPMLYGCFLVYDEVPFVMSNLMGGEWYGHYFEEQLPFAGVNSLELAWDKFMACQLQCQYKLTTNNIILVRMAAAQDAPTFKELLDHRTMLGGTLSYYYNTMLGPLGGSIGYSGVTKKFYYYVNLGFVF